MVDSLCMWSINQISDEVAQNSSHVCQRKQIRCLVCSIPGEESKQTWPLPSRNKFCIPILKKAKESKKPVFQTTGKQDRTLGTEWADRKEADL